MTSDDGAAAEGGTPTLRVRVDHRSCSGTAHCQQSMPEVFVLINRKSHVRADIDWSSIDVDQLQAVAEACPWYAISVDTPTEGS